MDIREKLTNEQKSQLLKDLLKLSYTENEQGVWETIKPNGKPFDPIVYGVEYPLDTLENIILYIYAGAFDRGFEEGFKLCLSKYEKIEKLKNNKSRIISEN